MILHFKRILLGKILSETAGAQENEPMDDSVTLEHPQIASMENTVALEESIRQKTQISVKQ